MPVLVEPLNLGDLLRHEAPNLYSRDRVTVVSDQNLPLGMMAGIVIVTAKFKQLDPSVEDGMQVAAGVLLQACDATLINRDDSLVVTCHAIVAHHAFAWPDAITTAEKLTAIAQLKAPGTFARQGA